MASGRWPVRQAQGRPVASEEKNEGTSDRVAFQVSYCELGEKFFGQLIAGEFEICGYIGENLGKCSDFEGSVRRDGHVVLNSLKTGRKAHVAARLACDFIAVASQGASEFVATEVTR